MDLFSLIWACAEKIRFENSAEVVLFYLCCGSSLTDEEGGGGDVIYRGDQIGSLIFLVMMED